MSGNSAPHPIASAKARYESDVQAVAAELRKLPEGGAARLEYIDIARLLALAHWKLAANSAALRGAIRLVEEQDRVVLVRDAGLGVRRGTEGDRLQRAQRRAIACRGLSVRAVADLMIAREDLMTDEQLRTLAARFEQFGRVIPSVTAEGFRQIHDAQGALPPRKALEVFKKPT